MKVAELCSVQVYCTKECDLFMQEDCPHYDRIKALLEDRRTRVQSSFEADLMMDVSPSLLNRR